MEINCVLKVSEILKVVYALSALRTYMSHTERDLPLLTRDNAHALRLLAGDAFSRIIVRLLPEATGCDMPEETVSSWRDDDTMSVTLVAHAYLGQNVVSAIRRVLEDAVAYETLHDIFIGFDSGLANSYSNRASESIANIFQLLNSGGTQTGVIVPHY